jgi:hypothetical protein
VQHDEADVEWPQKKMLMAKARKVHERHELTNLMAVMTLSCGGGDTVSANSFVVVPKLDISNLTFKTVFSNGMRIISASSKAGMHFSWNDLVNIYRIVPGFTRPARPARCLADACSNQNKFSFGNMKLYVHHLRSRTCPPAHCMCAPCA